MAFVVIQHLSPDFKSLMDDLLARHTRMKIIRVTNGVDLAADTIYLIPPRSFMTVSDGKLFLAEKTMHPTSSFPLTSFSILLPQNMGRKVSASFSPGPVH